MEEAAVGVLCAPRRPEFRIAVSSAFALVPSAAEADADCNRTVWRWVRADPAIIGAEAT